MKNMHILNKKNPSFIITFTNSFFFLILSISFLSLLNNVHAYSVYNLISYNFAKNESYVDTFEDKDIYWNPHAGFGIDVGIYQKLENRLEWRLQFGSTFGYFNYDTTDGRKINTETESGNTPKTKNTEWSRIFSLVPTIGAYIPFGNIDINFGVGAGPYLCRSYESWEFKNTMSQDAYLEIKKYYPLSLGMIGRLGMRYQTSNNLSILIEMQFVAVNFIMEQVDLVSYTLDNKEQIKQYNRQQITYAYARDMPDENKGGEALLAGFGFANYPQEKIATVVSLKIGASYGF